MGTSHKSLHAFLRAGMSGWGILRLPRVTYLCGESPASCAVVCGSHLWWHHHLITSVMTPCPHKVRWPQSTLASLAPYIHRMQYASAVSVLVFHFLLTSSIFWVSLFLLFLCCPCFMHLTNIHQGKTAQFTLLVTLFCFCKPVKNWSLFSIFSMHLFANFFPSFLQPS